VIETKGFKDTIKLGARIASKLGPNDVVALIGPLGAGKTTLIQGIAKGLGITNYVTSPTFTIINEFKGRLPLYHVDLYRLEHIDVEDIALDEYFEKGGITVIEWADKIKDLLPKNAKEIKIKIKGVNKRSISLKGIEV
jgi:tRNA threonylcarbamoyladenosine biosynthesis protein TsaE